MQRPDSLKSGGFLQATTPSTYLTAVGFDDTSLLSRQSRLVVLRPTVTMDRAATEKGMSHLFRA